jgi:DNA repair exonuclease SbcCD ATPase subunit
MAAAHTKFRKDRSYKIGEARTADQMRINWKSRPKPAIWQGSQLIDAGIDTLAKFWASNPISGPQKTIHTIAEIDPESKEEMLFDQGSFHGPKTAPSVPGAAAPTLGDVPPLQAEPTMTAREVRVYEDRINELRTTNEALNRELAQVRTAHDAYVAQANERAQKQTEEILNLRTELRDKATELRVLEEKVLPRMQQAQQDAQLGDRTNAIVAVAAPLVERLADRFLGRFFDGPAPSATPSAAPGTSDDLDTIISQVGS